MSILLERASARLNQISRAINAKIFILGAASVGLMAIPTTLDVIGGLFHHPMSSAQELVEFLQVIVVYATLAYIQDERGHIYVELICNRFSERTSDLLKCALYGVTTVVFGVIAWRLSILGMDKFASGEVSMILSLPIWLFVFFAAFGAFMTAFSLLATTVEAAANLLKHHHGFFLLMALILLALLIASPWLLGEFPWTTHKTLLGASGMALLMLALLLGLPVGLAMLVVGFLGMLLVYPFPAPALNMMGVNSYSTAANYM